MKHRKNSYNYRQEKITGKLKELVGKITGHEQLELKGKIQATKADIRKNLSISQKMENVKERLAGLANDKLDNRSKRGK